MAFNAILKFDGGNAEGYEVVRSMHVFAQSTDDKGRPSSLIQGGGIFVQVVATEDSELFKLMIDPYRRFSGSITFKRQDADAKLKDVTFADAYCVQLTDSFSHERTSTVTVTLSAMRITVAGAALTNKW